MWHLNLNEALWSYRTIQCLATGTTPNVVTYGHDAILPMEINVNFLRVAEQSD